MNHLLGPRKCQGLIHHQQHKKICFFNNCDKHHLLQSFFLLWPPNSITAPPAAVIRKLPQPLTALKKHLYAEMSQEELRAACKEVFRRITVSQEECAYLEQCTRLQSQSKLWFEHRIGRITASMFSVVVRASLDSPPASLVKQLMERRRLFSSVPAIQWGIEHEDVARKAYLELAREKHINLHYTSAGLYINPSFPISELLLMGSSVVIVVVRA